MAETVQFTVAVRNWNGNQLDNGARPLVYTVPAADGGYIAVRPFAISNFGTTSSLRVWFEVEKNGVWEFCGGDAVAHAGTPGGTYPGEDIEWAVSFRGRGGLNIRPRMVLTGPLRCGFEVLVLNGA